MRFILAAFVPLLAGCSAVLGHQIKPQDYGNAFACSGEIITLPQVTQNQLAACMALSQSVRASYQQ